MFSHQVVWITGASSGIGEALALQFAAGGSRLVLSARRQAELERVKHRCEQSGLRVDQILVLPLDVTENQAMPKAVEQVLEQFGSIDVLINNAGIGQRSLCVDTDMLVYRKVMEVNVFGPIALTRAVLPVMLKQGRGHIAVTASVAGKIGTAQRTAYCAAKHAVFGFFDALRVEVDRQGLSVTTIVPGNINTAATWHALTGDGSHYGKPRAEHIKSMDVDRCAALIMRGFRCGEPEIAVVGGPEKRALWLKRLFPKQVFKRVAQPD